MRHDFFAENLVDLHNDTGFQKLASFAEFLTPEEQQVNVAQLIEKQAYDEDSTYADDMNRMFSIASPIETKLSALYAIKCASLLPEEVVNKINDACNIYNLNIQVPVVNKVASILEDKEILEAIEIFDQEYVEKEASEEPIEKYAHATEYGNQLDTCLAARAFYATEAEDVESIKELAKIASSIDPSTMVNLLHEIDSNLGLDTPAMQQRVGTPEYAVYEKIASENEVNLAGKRVPFDVVANFQDEIADLGVTIDWDGDTEDAITLQLEQLPTSVKEEIGSWVN